MGLGVDKRIVANITAIGGFVPENRRTNFDLEKVTETSDEWIVKRTGIKERRILDEGLATSDMAVEAIKNLAVTYSIDLATIDCLMVATSTPDMLMPATANIIAGKLGIENIWAFDINAACSGFLYALNMGSSLVESGRYKRVLVVGADKISSYVDVYDRSTNILFGDGAGVVLLEPSADQNGLLDAILMSNGTGKESLHIEGGGSMYPASETSIEAGRHFIKQDGKVVFKNAIQSMSDTCINVVKRNNYTMNDVQWLIPHQANKRIIDAVGKEIEIEEGKTLVNIEKYGNTIAATIPLCMWENVHRLKKGDLILLTAFGAGFSWGSTLLNWTLD